jgi:hypothetical protein
MLVRRAVLSTPPISLRLSLLSCCNQNKQSSFHSLYTLPSSVSRKSFACHSYKNCRGVYQQFPFWNYELCARQPDQFARSCRSFLPLCALCVRRLTRQGRGDLCVSLFSLLSTLDSQPLPPSDLSSFLSHSCALFCNNKKLNPFPFNRFRTLCRKPPGVGGGEQIANAE